MSNSKDTVNLANCRRQCHAVLARNEIILNSCVERTRICGGPGNVLIKLITAVRAFA